MPSKACKAAPTTPHAAMKALDAQGTAYTVTFNFLGCPSWQSRPVYACGNDWMLVQDESGRRVFVNLRYVASLRIEEC